MRDEMTDPHQHFPDPFDSRLYGYRDKQAVWKITHYFRYTNPAFPTITVPCGALTDGASIPQILHSSGLGPTGPYFRGAVIHDHLYSLDSSSRYSAVTRRMADDIFRAAIIDCGCSRSLAFTMWLAVRACGWMCYKKPEGKIEKV
jgi:hypothetical protein